ncbi:proteasome subunit beta type [Striga asiatica]|uniref:Proteasome subunit beta type n=1 Tax=Striga asiatica TaxID=4170 RepID=A0A5A7QUV0_STRAF|nr:proteasome subunit beta type [Striga asiatica]
MGINKSGGDLADSTPAMSKLLGSEADSQRTLYPYVTGTSVVGIKYKDGILLAADMGGSYGSTLRYKTVERLKPVGRHSVIGASGEISDFQEIMRYLDELILYDNMWDDGNSLGPKEVHNYLTRVMYNRRNKFNPLWNSLVLGGIKNGQKYLGTVSMIGVHYEDNHLATGFGNHLARPILRDEWNENLTYEEGVKLLEKCMRVLLYRDRSAVNKLQIAKITEEGITISKPYALKTFWDFNAFKNPTAEGEEKKVSGGRRIVTGFSPVSSAHVFWKSRRSSAATNTKNTNEALQKPSMQDNKDKKEPANSFSFSILSEKRKALFESLEPVNNANGKRPSADSLLPPPDFESATYPKGWLIGKKRKLVNVDVVESMRRIAVQEMNRKDREIDGLNEQLEEDARCLEHLQLQLLDERSKRADVERQNAMLQEQITMLMEMVQENEPVDEDEQGPDGN